jgi:hypothetical protein
MWRVVCAFLLGCSLVIDPQPPVDAFVVSVDGPPDALADACGVERCNDLDDDCDGTVDEGEDGPLRQACYPFDEGEPGQGRCGAGVARCADGAYGLCEEATGPTPEQDNGIDDDCDGEVDED